MSAAVASARVPAGKAGLLARGGLRLLLAAGALVLVAALARHELRATPWRELTRELGAVPANFLLPLDMLSKGAQTSLETGPRGEKILWGYGPATRLRFSTPVPMRLRLCYSFGSPLRDAAVTLTLNGEDVAAYDAKLAPLPDDAGHPECREFTSRPGDNRIVFAYRVWNHGGSDFAADDPRRLAVTFTMLQLLPVPQARPSS